MKTRAHDSHDDAKALSPAQRILLAEEIWDSIASTPEAVPITKAHHTELYSRLDRYAQNPGAGSEWNAVRDRIAKRAWAMDAELLIRPEAEVNLAGPYHPA